MKISLPAKIEIYKNKILDTKQRMYAQNHDLI